MRMQKRDVVKNPMTQQCFFILSISHNGRKIEEESEISTFVLCFFLLRYLQTTKRFGKHHRRKRRKKVIHNFETKLFELVNITQRLVKRHEVINNFKLKKQQ